MTQEPTTGKAEQLTAKMKKVWAKLSDTELKLYSSKREDFLAKLKDHYGLTKADAEKKIKEMEEANEKANPESAIKVA